MKSIVINREIFRDKVMGCWLGKNAGGTLGEPVEEKFGKDEMFHVDWYPSLPEGGIPNDDLELQLIWLQLILKKGPGITAADFTEAWMDCVAYNFDEYGLSKENMQKGLMPPVCGWNNNAFRDCMGSPIRSEIWACLSPGCPRTAAWYAFQDAVVDHGGGESVYGEIFNAVLESAAFVNSDKFELLELALASIPESCLTHQCVRRAIDNYHSGMEYADNRNDLKNAFYNPVAQYSPLNLGFQTIGWLYGEDFGDSICKAVNCGWDTDCTAATLGAVLGIIGGASSLPDRWLKPLGYRISTNMTTGGIRNLTAPTDIRELTETVCRQAERVCEYWGNPVRFEDDAKMDSGVQLDVPDLSWMKAYRPNELLYDLGGIRAAVAYDKDAAILGDRPSRIELRLYNDHPIEKRVQTVLCLPDGFHADPAGQQRLDLKPDGCVQVFYSVTAGAEAIRDANRGWFQITIEGEPAPQTVPLVLLGGSRWLFSPFFEGKQLDDDCGVLENRIFDGAPENFREQWNPGNRLCLENDFTGKGVIYGLHYIYTQEEREVVLGVPNNGYMKLFLNGEFQHRTVRKVPVRANLGNGGALGDLSNYCVTKLKAGWNQILIKLEASDMPQDSHFTIGGMSRVCSKNHGMPVLGIIRSAFPWEGRTAHMKSCIKPGYLSRTVRADDRRMEFDSKNQEIVQHDTRVDVLFIGDSVIQMWELPVYFADCGLRMINRGIGGDRTGTLLHRFRADAIQLKPSVCVIMAGVNDSWELETDPWKQEPAAEVESILRDALANMEEVLKMSADAGIKTVLCSALPTAMNWTQQDAQRNVYVKLYNDGLKELALQYGAAYADFYREFVRGGSASVKPELTREGLHPNVFGYDIMARILKETMGWGGQSAGSAL